MLRCAVHRVRVGVQARGGMMGSSSQTNQPRLQTEVSHIHKPSMGLHVDQHHCDFVFIMRVTWAQFIPRCLRAANISVLLNLLRQLLIDNWISGSWKKLKTQEWRWGVEEKGAADWKTNTGWKVFDCLQILIGWSWGFWWGAGGAVAAVYLLLLAVSLDVDTVPLTYIPCLLYLSCVFMYNRTINGTEQNVGYH